MPNATGRASASQDLTATEYEEVFAFLYDLYKTVPFDIKTTEAQHYRRYVAQRRDHVRTFYRLSNARSSFGLQRCRRWWSNIARSPFGRMRPA